MGKKKNFRNDSTRVGGYDLALAKDRQRLRSLTVELKLQADALTQKDMRSWRQAHQRAIHIESPRRGSLYDIYRDVELDGHLTGCVEQRKGFVLRKAFKLVDAKGKENEEAKELLETDWFQQLAGLVLDSRYWGHSLIQLGDPVEVEGMKRYNDVTLVPRKHVLQEYGVVIQEQGDEWTQGIPYREGPVSDWVIEAGGPRDLGLYLKAAAHTIPKKNMLAYWDQFGEIFGMPIRIAKSTSRDTGERSRIEDMLSRMGAAAWGLFPEGTDIEIKETTRGDAFNVYDKRIDRANGEISKCILNQTMTIDNGSSLSQSQVHLDVFKNVVESDADMLRNVINDQLLPRMVRHGFPVKGLRFRWDDSVDYTPEQQVQFETMLLEHFDCDPKFFEEKYGVKILGKKRQEPPSTALSLPFFD